MDAPKTSLVNTQKPVLIVALAKYFGGADVRVYQLAKMLKAINYPFIVAVLSDSPLHQQLIESNIPVVSVRNSRADPRLIFKLKKIVQEGGYQVIDTHNPQSHLWGLLTALLCKGVRVVTTVHGCYGDAEKGWRSALYNGVLKANAGFPDKRFIAVSDSVQQYLVRLDIAKADITYIPNAVAPETRLSTVTIRNLTNWPEDAVVVAIAARLEPVKGVNCLISAMAEAVKTNPLLKLFIMGEGRARALLEDQVRQSGIQGAVFFAGFRQDVSVLLNSADIFCLSSLSEGLPFALLEAATAKLPLILSKVGGMAEFFEHDYSALMFPAGDVQQLSRHLLLLADDPAMRERLASAAFQTVDKNFSAQRLLEQTIAIYNN